MSKTTDKSRLPLPERVIALAAAGRGVEIDSDSARSLARDAIRLREVRDHVSDAIPARRTLDCRDWADWAAVIVLLIAVSQLIDWGFVIFRWVF